MRKTTVCGVALLVLWQALLLSCHGPENEHKEPPISERVTSAPPSFGVFDATGVREFHGVSWKFKGASIILPPVVSDDTVYVVAGENALCAVNRKSGELKWTFRGKDELCVPTVSKGTIYLRGRNRDGCLYSIDARTGEEKWKFETGGLLTPLELTEKAVYFISQSDKELYAVDSVTGRKIWSFRADILDGPVVDNGVVYVAGEDGFIGLSAKTGAVAWRSNVRGGYPYFAVSDGVIYVWVASRTWWKLG
jgi:outer membrane protein assembly factor BamB